MKVLVGSTNPVKIAAVKEAFGRYFKKIEVEGIATKSGVPEQPVGDQNFVGAEQRALELYREHHREADFFVGAEGGIRKIYGRWFDFGCFCIIDKDKRKAFGTSPWFELPKNIVKKLLNGEELGPVIDDITGQKNCKQKEGAIGYFTNNVMSRKELYVAGLVVALAPFIRKELFFSNKK
jgi:inosine/xanthosine triphosphatase